MYRKRTLSLADVYILFDFHRVKIRHVIYLTYVDLIIISFTFAGEIVFMKNYSLGEFEELILLVVAASDGESYGVTIREKLIEKLNKNVNISAIHVSLKRLEDKG